MDDPGIGRVTGARRRPGRPSTFDRARAREAVMLAFWRDGWAGVSVNEVARASGASKPVLYDAFGGKDGLMCEAMRAYHERWGEAAEAALASGGSLRYDLAAWFSVSIGRMDDPSLPSGCLLVDAAMDRDRLGPLARELLDRFAERSAATLGDRLERGAVAGELRAPSGEAAAFLAAQQAALAMLSTAEAGRPTLNAAARLALDAVCRPGTAPRA